MSNRFKSYLQSITTRHALRRVAFVVLGMSVGVLMMLHGYPYLKLKYEILFGTPAVVIEQIPEEQQTESPFARSLPTHLRIPKINVDTSFVAPLSLHEDQSVEVPDSFEKVGWYGLGVSPGENGPAVIFGHVDSVKGPAVFYSLGQLSPGDPIYVTRADGTEVMFEVVNFERYPQEVFPTELVYGMVPYPALRLITCSGTYIKGEQHYTHNLVVYAKLATSSIDK